MIADLLSALLQVSAPPRPPVRALVSAMYDFDCVVTNERGAQNSIVGRIGSPVEGSVTMSSTASFDVTESVPTGIAGRYGAVMVGDAIILDNMIHLVSGKATVANRIIVDRALIGPGTLMVKSTRLGAEADVYFGRCAPRRKVVEE